MTSRKVLLVIRSAPYRTFNVSVSMRVASAMIAWDTIPKLLFLDDGVYCLMRDQKPEVLGLESHKELFETLSDLLELYADEESMTKRGLTADDLDERYRARILPTDGVVELIEKNEVVIAF